MKIKIKKLFIIKIKTYKIKKIKFIKNQMNIVKIEIFKKFIYFNFSKKAVIQMKFIKELNK